MTGDVAAVTLSPILTRYLALESKMLRARVTHGGVASPEEDALLRAMDDVWWEMSEADRVRLKAQPVPTTGKGTTP